MINSFLENNYEEVDFDTFYRELFPAGSFEQKGIYEDGKYNGIAISIGSDDKKVRRYTITDDLEKLAELVETDDFCLISPISYIGKSRKSENARHLYALAIDLDGIRTEKNMRELLLQIEQKDIWRLRDVPKPTYLVSSGTGIHIYYFFKKPIALFPSAVKELEKLKRRLTWHAWCTGISQDYDNVQYESLFQGFRMVGSITKVGTRVRAFRVGEKVDIEYLNNYVPEEYRATDLSYKSNLPLNKAKELYPEWYEKRIVQKQPKGSWTCKRDLYDWWKKKLTYEIKEGHRYWSILTLATYAVKCGIDYEELEKDAFEIRPYLSQVGEEPFTTEDVVKALEAYNDSYITYPIDTISERTGVRIEKNKRNGRSQKEHLERARAVQNIDYPNGEWRGRKSKEELVHAWRNSHPNGTKYQCQKDTGLSKNTIRKWW